MSLLAAVLVLVGLTAWVLRPGGGRQHTATTPNTARTSSSNAALTTSSPRTTSAPTSSAKTTAQTTPHPSSTVPATCSTSQLRVMAVPGKSNYAVGDEPQLMMQVTNQGPAPCVQNLADSQVELRVYNGESRVWGSHDCEVQPGTDARTLTVGQAVRVSIVWSGLSSQPNCAGTRQRVGAGTYTLYALLGGHTGLAAQFSIS